MLTNFLLSQIMELRVLSRLMKMVNSNSLEEANKALYAVSALTRNNLASQELFYAEAGGWMLQVDYLRFIIMLILFWNKFSELTNNTDKFLGYSEQYKSRYQTKEESCTSIGWSSRVSIRKCRSRQTTIFQWHESFEICGWFNCINRPWYPGKGDSWHCS